MVEGPQFTIHILNKLILDVVHDVLIIIKGEGMLNTFNIRINAFTEVNLDLLLCLH